MAYKQYSREEKKAYKDKQQSELDKMYEQIDEGVKKVFTSENYKKYLDTVSRFNRYSPNNILLIMQQNPNATLVGSYRKWQEYDRHVKKKEKAIYILKPIRKTEYTEIEQTEKDKYGNPVINADGSEKTKNVRLKEEKIVGFARTAVFDISQTDGKPINNLVKPLSETVTKEYSDAISAALDELIHIKHEYEPLDDNCSGYCDCTNKRIVLNENLNNDQHIKTHIHETAHYLLHGKDGSERERPKEQREMQAESVAYIVCSRLGIDTSDYSFGYIASWIDRDTDDLKMILKDTQKATELIYKHIEPAIMGILSRKQTENIPIHKETLDITESGRFVWTYYDTDANNGNGQFVKMEIDDNNIRKAFKARMMTEKVYGYEKGIDTFIGILQREAHTELIGNNDPKQFAELAATFASAEHGISFDMETISERKQNDLIRSFILQNSTLMSQLERAASRDGYKPVKTDMAAVMWENGFSVLDPAYRKIPPYNYQDISANDYSVFENVKDFTFHVTHNDHWRQQLFDEISECLETIADSEDYALYELYDEYDWSGYDDNISITGNVQDALRRNDLLPLQEYLYDVAKECVGKESAAPISAAAEQAMRAIAELTDDIKREKHNLRISAQQADEILDLTLGIGGRSLVK